MQPFGTLKGLEQSMNPQLMKYARETDVSIALSRRENRLKLFVLYPQLSSHAKSPLSSPESVDPYKEIFGHRILLKCESIKFKLQAVDDKEYLCQIEPYYTTLFLYDAKLGKKLTENFHFDVNQANVRPFVNRADPGGSGVKTDLPEKLSEEWLLYPRQTVLNITNAHSDIFLVVRIEKVLQGGICQSSEPYIRATKDPKAGLKVQKNFVACCQRLGSYRMPFAWTARPLFRYLPRTQKNPKYI